MTDPDNSQDNPIASKPNRAALAMVFVTVFIDLLGFGIVLPVLPRYGEAFKASGMTLGLLMASFSAMQFVFAPLWGRISDRIGRRPVLLVGLAGSTFFYGLFGVATALGPEGKLLGMGVLSWLFITRIGAGIAGATISTAQAYIADITGRKDRAKGMALIGAAFGIGFVFGPLIGAACLHDADPTRPPALPGYIASAMSGIALLWAIFLLPESLKSRDAQQAAATHGLVHLARFLNAFRLPVIGVTLISSFFTILAFAQFESTLSLLTDHLELSLFQNSLVYTYIGVILTIVQAGVVRRIAPKVGEFRMAITGVSILMIGLILIGLTGQTQSVTQLILVIPLAVIGFAFANPAFYSLLSLNTPADEQGEMLGVGQSVSALARIAGPVIGLSLKGPAGQWSSMPYWVAAGVMCLAWLMTLTLRNAHITQAVGSAPAGEAPGH